MNIDKEAIKLVRRVTKISFEENESKLKKFAKEFVKTNDSLNAYNIAFEKINQVRASTLLLETETWEFIIHQLKQKEGKSIKEKEIIALYDLIEEVFQLSPFAIFDIYVQKCEDDQPLCEKMAISSTLCFSSLLYAHHFFRIIEREYFYRLTFFSLQKEIEKMRVFGQDLEIASIVKAAKKEGIDSYEIFEK